MNFKRLNFVLLVILALTSSTYGYIDPESPYAPEPVDVIAYSYTDSYWDVTPNSQNTGYMTDENNVTLPAYENGTLNFYGSITSDYNPWAQTQCQWNQNMMLLDLSIGQLLSMGSLSGWGSTMFASWSFSGGGPEAGIQLNAMVAVDNCGPTMPQMPLGGIGGTIIDGISGTSHSRYIHILPAIPNPVFYEYKHNTSHTREECPARCAMIIPQNVVFVSTGGYPRHEIDVELPFDKRGICATAWIYRDDPDVRCRNTYNLPF